MFSIAEVARFTTLVTIMTPNGEGHREDTVRATFRAIGDTEMLELLQNTDDARTFLNAVVEDVLDITDADGKPLAFEPDVARAVFDLPYVRLAFVAAYQRAIRKVKTGN